MQFSSSAAKDGKGSDYSGQRDDGNHRDNGENLLCFEFKPILKYF